MEEEEEEEKEEESQEVEEGESGEAHVSLALDPVATQKGKV